MSEFNENCFNCSAEIFPSERFCTSCELAGYYVCEKCDRVTTEVTYSEERGKMFCTGGCPEGGSL